MPTHHESRTLVLCPALAILTLASCSSGGAKPGSVCSSDAARPDAAPCQAVVEGDALAANGASCAADGDCQSGACVGQVCAVRECRQLAASPLGPIEVADVLQGSAPSENPAKGAVLLTGDFTNVARLCFDDQELPQQFSDASNVMIQMPKDASLGAHIVRAILSDGRASSPFALRTVSAYSRSRIVPSVGNGPEPALFPPTDDIFTPTPKADVDPITNEWHDAFRGGNDLVVWRLGGEPWSSSTITGKVLDAAFPQTYADIVGEFDRAHKRITLTVSPTCDPGAACPTWSYVGIFSCRPDVPMCTTFDPCRDMWDQSTASGDSNWNSQYSRELVLFPVGAADPQGVLRLNGKCP